MRQCNNRECRKDAREKSKYCSEACRFREGYLRKTTGECVHIVPRARGGIKNFSAKWLQDLWDKRQDNAKILSYN